jgi:hypothetical protein
MVRSCLPKAVLLLVLVLILAMPLQAADSRPVNSGSASVQGILAQIWDFLTGVWAENGCDIDPDGRYALPPSPTAQIDSGCDIDPSGRCVPRPNPTAQLDNGCDIDPNGRCSH